MKTVKININLHDIRSIKRAETRKANLKDAGYSLISEIIGSETATLIYKYETMQECLDRAGYRSPAEYRDPVSHLAW